MTQAAEWTTTVHSWFLVTMPNVLLAHVLEELPSHQCTDGGPGAQGGGGSSQPFPQLVLWWRSWDWNPTSLAGAKVLLPDRAGCLLPRSLTFGVLSPHQCLLPPVYSLPPLLLSSPPPVSHQGIAGEGLTQTLRAFLSSSLAGRC